MSKDYNNLFGIPQNLSISTSQHSGTTINGSGSYTKNIMCDGSVSATDYLIDGVSIVKTLTKIEERLLILTPDPAKLAKYEALRTAYDNYKLLEGLLSGPDNGK